MHTAEMSNSTNLLTLTANLEVRRAVAREALGADGGQNRLDPARDRHRRDLAGSKITKSKKYAKCN